MIDLFFKHPLGAIAYLFLILAILSIWIHRKILVWGSLLAVGLSFAFYGDLIRVQAFIPLVIVGGGYFFANLELSQFWRLFTCMIAAIITIALYTHFVKGFNNILVFTAFRSSLDATPLNIYANFDKGAIAAIMLGFYLPVIKTRKELYSCLLATIPWMLFTALGVLALAQFLQIIKWDPKLPLITLMWLTIQLFFVAIPEEVFYRGFIQNEIVKRLNNPFGSTLAILVTSLLFTGIHILILPNLAFLTTIFITSILYGIIYQLTGKIESAIITHYFTNICHFFFFTYPMLQV